MNKLSNGETIKHKFNQLLQIQIHRLIQVADKSKNTSGTDNVLFQ